MMVKGWDNILKILLALSIFLSILFYDLSFQISYYFDKSLWKDNVYQPSLFLILAGKFIN